MKEHFTKTGNSIFNPDIGLFLEKNIGQIFTKNYDNMHCLEEYLNEWPDWIKRSKLNDFSGLEYFNTVHSSLGVTQALDEFHYLIARTGRRLRMLRGEYPYNRDVCEFYESRFIDRQNGEMLSPLKENDALIISIPFSGNGKKHHLWDEIIKQANEKDVPVFVDCAWFGTCADIEINFNEKCIQYVAFSTTKSLTCGNYRNGIRFSKNILPTYGQGNSDRLALQYQWNHSTHLNNYIGLLLMREFGPDTLYDKYKDTQIKICKEHNIIPSNCVHIALGDDTWFQYSRDGAYNRINLRDAIKKIYKSS